MMTKNSPEALNLETEPARPVIIDKIQRRFSEVNSMAGVGIDPVWDRLPHQILNPDGSKSNAEVLFEFSRQVINATSEYIVDFKVNSNFFMGPEGRQALEWLFTLLKEQHPNIIRICDGKFADVGHTAQQLAIYTLDTLDADAVLLNPYLGYDALAPFLERPDKAAVLCFNTSNPSAADIQELQLENGQKLWHHIMETAFAKWNTYGNIIPVVSATHPQNLVGIRDIIGDTPVVLAGVGNQGGDVTAVLQDVLDSQQFGVMISSSRGIIYPELNEGEEYWDAVKRKAAELKSSINTAKRALMGDK